MALCYHWHYGYQSESFKVMGDNYHLFQLRLWVYSGSSNGDRGNLLKIYSFRNTYEEI